MRLLGYADHCLKGVPFSFHTTSEKIVPSEPTCSPAGEYKATRWFFIQSFHVLFFLVLLLGAVI